jgi:hypothetical protein
MHFVPHRFPAATPPVAAGLVLAAADQPLDIRRHEAADFTAFECDGPVEITATFVSVAPSGTIILRPLRHGITVAPVADGRTRFTLPGPGHYQLEIPGRPLLYLYALPPAAPAPTGPGVRVFAGGQVHDAGRITLADGETVWLEPGAVVRGHIRADHARGVRVGGTGLLEGGLWSADEPRRDNLRFAHCRDVVVENLLVTATSGWMIHLGDCEGVEIRGVRELSQALGTDGVDIVGSRHVAVIGCCFHNGDDNIAVKAIDFSAIPGRPAGDHHDFSGPVAHIRVQGCVFHNLHGGSSMEIGYETRTARIHDVRFDDIDVLAVHHFGSVFGIHNGDRATVEDIHWSNIRVEHHYDKLIDFRVLHSRWNHDYERGRIRDVSLRDITVASSPYNPGYSLSVIAGYDADHAVERVTVENFRLGNVHVRNADQLDLVTRHAHAITFV